MVGVVSSVAVQYLKSHGHDITPDEGQQIYDGLQAFIAACATLAYLFHKLDKKQATDKITGLTQAKNYLEAQAGPNPYGALDQPHAVSGTASTISTGASS